MALFTELHGGKISGTISCFDRVIFMGTIPGICYAQGITNYFYQNKMRIFDFQEWAKPLRKEIRKNTEGIAVQNGVDIEFIRKTKDFAKDKRIKKILGQRGDHPGLVHIFSAMETCSTYRPWHDKNTHRTFLRYDKGKCLHYYFYFIDPFLGLCYLRVPTWAPFRLQFYFNGHNLLGNKLKNEGVDFEMLDNAFVQIQDFIKAQEIANDIDMKIIRKTLDDAASRYCPVIRHFPQGYHWSIMQAEYATDIVFKRQKELAPIYDDLVRTTVHAVKPDNIAMFLGRKLHGKYQDELGNKFYTRIEGHCIKHFMGKNLIKMYDKFGLVLRIETVTNDVSFFKHHRRVEHRDGTYDMKLAPMRKTIYSLPELAKLLSQSNGRYIQFISRIDDPSNGIRAVERISRRVRNNGRSYRGFNLFDGDDAKIFRTIIRGEFCISGFRNKNIRYHLPTKSPWQISHVLKRLRNHGMIKKVPKSYKYYRTSLGKRIVSTSLKLKEMFVIPYLRGILNPS